MPRSFDAALTWCACSNMFVHTCEAFTWFWFVFARFALLLFCSWLFFVLFLVGYLLSWVPALLLHPAAEPLEAKDSAKQTGGRDHESFGHETAVKPQPVFFPQIAGSYRGSNFSKGGIVLAN